MKRRNKRSAFCSRRYPIPFLYDGERRDFSPQRKHVDGPARAGPVFFVWEFAPLSHPHRPCRFRSFYFSSFFIISVTAKARMGFGDGWAGTSEEDLLPFSSCSLDIAIKSVFVISWFPSKHKISKDGWQKERGGMGLHHPLLFSLCEGKVAAVFLSLPMPPTPKSMCVKTPSV